MKLRLLADHPVLNFINTVDPREGSKQIDHLHGFGDLLAWAQHAGILRSEAAGKISRQVERNPQVAKQAFKRAIELRESLYTTFLQVAAGQAPPVDTMARLLAAHLDALAHAAFIRTGNAFRWDLPAAPDLVRWRIANDAVALLESTDLPRVKRCPGSGDCGWMFFDTSKNAARRWCSMEGCGNRAKLRRFLHRKKARASRTSAKLLPKAR